MRAFFLACLIVMLAVAIEPRSANAIACLDQRAEDILASADAVFAGEFEQRSRSIKVTEAFKGVRVGDLIPAPRSFATLPRKHRPRLFAARWDSGKLFINDGPGSQNFLCQGRHLEREIETLRRLARG